RARRSCPPADAPMHVELGIWTRALAGEVTLDPGRDLWIGSGEDAELEIPGAELDPVHLDVRVDDRGARFVDLGKGSSVRIDGRAIEDAIALQGQRIEAGGAVFAVRYTEAAAPRAAHRAEWIRQVAWRSAEVHRGESEAARHLLGRRSLPLYALL